MDHPSGSTTDLDLRLARLRAHHVELRGRCVIDELTLGNWKAWSAEAGAAEIAVGDPWPAGETVAFERHTVTIPAGWPLGAARLEIDAGGAGHAELHSRLGRERHPIGPDAPALPLPTRAFGIRLEAHRAPPASSSDAATDAEPHFGVTRLVLLEPARLAAHAESAAEADAIERARAAGEDPAALEARLGALEAALDAVEELLPDGSGVG